MRKKVNNNIDETRNITQVSILNNEREIEQCNGYQRRIGKQRRRAMWDASLGIFRIDSFRYGNESIFLPREKLNYTRT